MLLSGIFVLGGARSAINPDPLVPVAKDVTERVVPLVGKVAPRLPADTRSLIRYNGIAQVVGGVLLATGFAARPAALLLAGSLVPTSVASHPFWSVDDPTQRTNQQIQFLKNLGLLGGLLLAAVDTQGKPSLRWRSSRTLGHGARSMRRMAQTVRRDVRIAKWSAAAARRLPG